MSASHPQTPDVQQQEDRRRRRKALLAGGLVLGLGAAVTFAAWSDGVFANGTFQTGSFNLIGSEMVPATAEGEYADWAETPGAPLEFKMDALLMAPGQTVAAPFSIAQKSSTSVDGRFWLANATAAGPLAPFLSYQIGTVNAAAECTADDPATAANEQTTLGAVWNQHTFGTGETPYTGQSKRGVSAGAEQDLDVKAGFANQQHLCILVTLAQDEAGITAANPSSGTTNIVWEFNGESGLRETS